MYSAYKLNKQCDNIQPWRTPFPIWNQGSQRVGHDWATELNWTEIGWLKGFFYKSVGNTQESIEVSAVSWGLKGYVRELLTKPSKRNSRKYFGEGHLERISNLWWKDTASFKLSCKKESSKVNTLNALSLLGAPSGQELIQTTPGSESRVKKGRGRGDWRENKRY